MVMPFREGFELFGVSQSGGKGILKDTPEGYQQDISGIQITVFQLVRNQSYTSQELIFTPLLGVM